MGTDQEQNKTSDVLVLRSEFSSLGAYVAPRTATERKLAEIFCKVLHMDKVSISDDFEELGGDSLAAVSICADIEDAFAVPVPVASFVHAPTITKLAVRIDNLISSRGA